MRFKNSFLTFAAFVAISGPAWCATVTSANTSNGALGEDLVVGDTKTTTIVGATPSASVTVHAFQNGTDVGTANPGTTDASGNFTVSGISTSASVGDRMDIWSVGGVQIGTIEYEIIPVPTTLTVKNVSVTTLSPSCGGATFGIDVDITYQVSSPSGTYNTAIPFVPFEDVTFYGNGNVVIGTAHQDIGPTSGYSDSSNTTDTQGVFHDVPVGTCSGGSFSNAGAAQVISMDIGDNNYPVRSSTRFVTNSSSSGHGTITNSLDVMASR